MRGKILLVVGLAAGYVLGAKAGRTRYNQIKHTAQKLWNDPRVQEQVTAVTEVDGWSNRKCSIFGMTQTATRAPFGQRSGLRLISHIV